MTYDSELDHVVTEAVLVGVVVVVVVRMITAVAVLEVVVTAAVDIVVAHSEVTFQDAVSLVGLRVHQHKGPKDVHPVQPLYAVVVEVVVRLLDVDDGNRAQQQFDHFFVNHDVAQNFDDNEQLGYLGWVP